MLAFIVFLVFTAVFALSKMLLISGGGVIEAQRESDSAAALMLAESGLEFARATITAAGTQTDALCTGLNTATNVSLGRGAYSVSGVSTPGTCGTGLNPICTNCRVTSSATVGTATRVLTYDFALGSSNGTSCNTANAVPDCTNASTVTWKLNLVNDQGAPAIGVFSMASKRQGNNTGAACTNANCRLEWNINSQNGANSVGSMGNAVPIPVGGSYAIYQTLTNNFNVAQVGALFVGSGTGPMLTGPSTTVASVTTYPVGGAAYWGETGNGSPNTSGSTVGKAADTLGYVNDGTTTDPTVDTTTTTPATGTTQTRTNWCFGGDTLVFGVAADANGLTDQFNSVVFGTDSSGTNANQSVPLTRVAKYPTSSIAGAPTNVFAEIWYARNADYLSSATATTGGVFTGVMGSSFTATFSNGSPTMNVTAVAWGTLRVGDRVVCSGGNCPAFLSSTSNVTISAFGTGSGGAGTYTLSASCANPNCGAGRTGLGFSTVLNITGVTSGALSTADTISGTGIAGGTTVTALGTGTGGTGTYVTTAIPTAQQNVASTTITANGPTVRLTAAGSVPSNGIPAIGTRLAVRTGTGALAPNTTVIDTPAPAALQFRLSATPTTRLVNATLCGGTCAFFRKGGVTTQFTVNKTGGANYWGGGFLCLKGVTQNPLVVNSLQVANRRWQEIPQ